MMKPDLVILKQGKPIAIVEAKARPVSAPFREAVRDQLRAYATLTNSPWSILVDPDDTLIFRRLDIRQPWVALPTGELLDASNCPPPKVLGERTLLRAVDRWVHELPRHPDILARHPRLREFADDVSDGITSTEEWPPRK
jgi:hypothetical protein